MKRLLRSIPILVVACAISLSAWGASPGFWGSISSSIIDTITVLSLHMNGTNGGTSFPDSSSYGQSVAATSNTTDTGTVKFGTASMKETSTNNASRLTVTSANSLKLTGDFTIGVWIYPTEATATRTNQVIYSKGSVSAKTYINLVVGAPTTNSCVDVIADTSNVWVGTACFANSGFSINTWHYYELDKSGTSWRQFMDGTQIGATITLSDTFGDNTTNAYIGNYTTTTTLAHNSYYDDFFVMNGQALHTSNFTPPTSPHSP